jgi:hypothetical protein
MTDIEKGARQNEARHLIQATLIAMTVTEDVITQRDVPELVASKALGTLSIATVRQLVREFLDQIVEPRETIDVRVWNTLYALDEHGRVDLLVRIDRDALNAYFNGAIAPLIRPRLQENSPDEREITWLTRAVELFINQSFLPNSAYEPPFPLEENLLRSLPGDQRLSSTGYTATLSLYGVRRAIQYANRRGLIEFVLLHAGTRDSLGITAASQPPIAEPDDDTELQGPTIRPPPHVMSDDELGTTIVKCVARHRPVQDGAWKRPLALTLQALILAETKRENRPALAARLSRTPIEHVVDATCAVLRISSRAYAREVIQLLRQKYPALPK